MELFLAGLRDWESAIQRKLIDFATVLSFAIG